MSVQLVVWTLNYAKKVPSIRLIATVYPVIAEPLFAGDTQLIVTSMFVLIDIVGAAGTFGTEAAKMATSFEKVILYPKMFLAPALNL